MATVSIAHPFGSWKKDAAALETRLARLQTRAAAVREQLSGANLQASALLRRIGRVAPGPPRPPPPTSPEAVLEVAMSPLTAVLQDLQVQSPIHPPPRAILSAPLSIADVVAQRARDRNAARGSEEVVHHVMGSRKEVVPAPLSAAALKGVDGSVYGSYEGVLGQLRKRNDAENIWAP